MTFSEVLYRLQTGSSFERKEWKGSRVVSLQKPDDKSRMTEPYIYIVELDDRDEVTSRYPYTPTMDDLFSTDWEEWH